MKMQAPKAMAKPFDINPMIKVLGDNYQQWLAHSTANEYLKHAKIAVLSMFGFVKDERTFSALAFIKEKLHNQLN
jgi:hypothetical protein